MCLLGFVSDLYSFGDLEEIQRHLFPVSRDGFKYNTELNDLRKIICLRKSEVYVKKVSIVFEKLLEHGIHSLPFSYINDVIELSL